MLCWAGITKPPNTLYKDTWEIWNSQSNGLPTKSTQCVWGNRSLQRPCKLSNSLTTNPPPTHPQNRNLQSHPEHTETGLPRTFSSYQNHTRIRCFFVWHFCWFWLLSFFWRGWGEWKEGAISRNMVMLAAAAEIIGGGSLKHLPEHRKMMGSAHWKNLDTTSLLALGTES